MSECCVLARVAKTQYIDSDRQKIISFEGVSVRPENEKQLFYQIPNLINEMLPPGRSFRALLEENGEMSDEFEFEPVLDPFDGLNIPREVHPDVKNNDAFKNLMKFTAFAEQPSAFIFGRNARDFSGFVDLQKLGIEYIFDYTNPDSPNVDENAFNDNYIPIVCEYKAPVPTGSDKVAIKLLVKENGENSYKYRWEAKPWDSSVSESNRARYVSKYYEIGDRVSLAKLELQKESMKKFLLDKGWSKQQFGLRFERDTFNREVR